MDTATFSPAIRELLSQDRVFDLGPGSANEPMRPSLADLTVEKLLAPAEVRRPDFARACLSGLWLYHDFLDESHALSVEIATAEGSFWHAIMHRREPDYANAAYWFRKVGPHPVFDALAPAALELAAASSVPVATPSPWNPFWFIDFCESCVVRKEPGEELARLIQKREWELLFEYCYRQAIGRSG
jgi:hypothetical protein